MKVTSEPLPASASSERARKRTGTYRSWARDWSHSLGPGAELTGTGLDSQSAGQTSSGIWFKQSC